MFLKNATKIALISLQDFWVKTSDIKSCEVKMLRKFLVIFGFMLTGVCVVNVGPVHAGKPLVAEAPVNGYGTPVTVSISTSTLTMVPTSQTAGRIGIYIDNPNSNNARVVGFFGNCTSTALASTIRPVEIAPSSNSTYFSMNDSVCLWLISLHTSAESVHYQEVKQ